MSKKPAGFIQLIPLLIITFVAISVLAISLQPKSKNFIDKAVLSESDSGGGHGSDSSGSSGSGSSGSGSSNTGLSGSGSSGSSSGSSASLEIRKVETPEPKETPEIKDQNEDEQELELENETELEVHEGTETAKIKLGKRNDRFAFFEDRFGAESEFPVSVNKTTRELTITTPQGTKVVAVLPDTAVENMLGQNVVDRVLGANGQLVEIKIDANGNVFYEVSGVKDEKLLGLFAVAVPKTVDISTQTGSITNVSQSFFSQLLDGLSF